MEKVLKSGQFAFTGELGPPRGTDVKEVKEKAQFLKGNVDSVNITDNQTAVVRMASWAASLILIQEGIEPNFQMVCRDRNRLAMQGRHPGGLRPRNQKHAVPFRRPRPVRRPPGRQGRVRYRLHAADRHGQADARRGQVPRRGRNPRAPQTLHRRGLQPLRRPVRMARA